MDRSLEMESELELEQESELEGELEFEGEGEGELELEQEGELEGELEQEQGEQFLGSIVSGLGGLLGGRESEGELELELEGEFEGETELEGEFEQEQGEQFFGAIGRLARRAAPFMKRLALRAAPLVGRAVAGAIGGPMGALAGKGITGLAGLLKEQELELEFEQEQEQELGEQEVSAELGEHEMMAEAMAELAAEAEQELEAEAMVGAATTITLSARDRRALRRMVPHLVRGAAVLTRILRLKRGTRPWVRAVPTIVRRTARTLTRSVAAGRPVTRARAAQVMARQTRRVLSSPRYAAAVMKRNARAARAVSRPLTAVSRRRVA